MICYCKDSSESFFFFRQHQYVKIMLPLFRAVVKFCSTNRLLKILLEPKKAKYTSEGFCIRHALYKRLSNVQIDRQNIQQKVKLKFEMEKG